MRIIKYYELKYFFTGQDRFWLSVDQKKKTSRFAKNYRWDDSVLWKIDVSPEKQVLHDIGCWKVVLRLHREHGHVKAVRLQEIVEQSFVSYQLRATW